VNLSLRRRFYLYLGCIHLLFAGVVWLVLREAVIWLVAVEGLFFLSLVVGVLLLRSLFAPLDLIRAGAEFIREHDFTTRFKEAGPTELVELIQVYNRMVDHLREERIRNQEQEHFVRQVLENSPLGVVTLDLDGRIATVNPGAEQLLGRSSEELAGLTLGEVGSPFAEQLRSVGSGETQILRLQGRRRVRCQKLSCLDRGFHRPFLLLDEMTEELHRSEKAAYGKLIRMMSHEVNNTAGAVNSLLQSCQTYRDQLRAADAEDYDRALQVAIARNQRMNAFMQGFAEVVRLPAPRRTACDVEALLRDVARLMHAQCTQQGIEWRWEVEAELGAVEMDAAQMELVFINVVKNAIEAIESVSRTAASAPTRAASGPAGAVMESAGPATGPAGAITVRIARERGRGLVTVRDTGPGIPPAVREQLFTPFFSTKADGRGIGLTMVQEILLAHGFDFALQDRPEGGTEFVVLF
jgi:two-component system nitrogen regulation sensor histidine kinase NtrY